MIKEIIFKNINSFSSQPISISLAKNVNVIIGPKGGGKSTLFDLIAGLKNNYIYDSVIKALETFDLKFEKAIKYSNEEILFSQLTKRKKKEKEEEYKNRNDVIYQDDQIKKDLTSFKEIEDNKFNYLKNQIEHSHNVDKLISEIKHLYLSMNKLNEYFKNEKIDINWTNTFKMKDLSNIDRLGLLTGLDYKPYDIQNSIDIELEEYKNIELMIDNYNTKIKRLSLFDKSTIIQDSKFDNELNKMIDQAINNNIKLIEIITKRKKELETIKSLTSLFLQSYKKLIEKIKNENYSSDGLRNYEVKAKNHFKNLAKDIFNVIVMFENIASKDLILNIENDENQKGVLVYKIPSNLKVDEETKFEILKTVFNSPGNSRDDVSKWLKSLSEKGIKEFKEDTIRNCIARNMKNDVAVLVDFGSEKREYESLSLGQKSIYGLKYKFNKSLNDNLYLDQPEDNLDNNTIAEEILPLFEKKKENQVIIVTHNANIGILSNPQRVIVADLNNREEPYKIADIEEVINDQSAHYLEGGKDYLKQRYTKIIESKGEN